MPDFYGKYTGIFGGGGGSGAGGVTSLNGETGTVDITSVDSSITIVASGQTIDLSASTAGSPFQEVPTGAIDGSNVTFALSVAPNPVASLSLYLDGLVLDQGVDYNISGTAITMTAAPLPGQTLYAVFTVIGAGSAAVDDVNGVVGSVNIVAGSGISVTTVGQNITVANTGGTVSRTVVGTRAAPILITAAGGIAFSGTQDFTKIYIAGSGGSVVVTAAPQIAGGTVDGQELTLQARSANTVTLANGNGLAMNGPWVGGLNSVITFTWDTVVWVEKGRQ